MWLIYGGIIHNSYVYYKRKMLKIKIVQSAIRKKLKDVKERRLENLVHNQL